MTKKETLLGKTLDELKEIAVSLGMPAYSAGQIAKRLYGKRAATIDEMTEISKQNRELLNEKYETGRRGPVEQQISSDGTAKYLFPVSDGQFVESVFIPDRDRATLCVSSQIGCKMNCLFCMTGKQGFSGQLTAAEILNQALSVPESERLSNFVFMGMGEPLDNYDNLLKVLEIMTAPYGMALSPKRITVSTVGLLRPLKRFLDESRCHLAISLHSPFHDERLSLMPAEKAFPAAGIVETLRTCDFSGQRRLSFEYIMFAGLNDSAAHALALAKLLKGMECRVNLIRYHSIGGVNLQGSAPEKMLTFRDLLNSKGVIATIRASRGEDILAACGMLSTEKKAEIKK
ncbi:MAG: 23S rRNA (adenine(2503)-C(2))-methyltransferase RlmN [Dysgonamonadaceae bacterium]|jgi:23S rRNA (adenine2503-C2)-methyltransferase|nr:23S rRNA (adenine(2503)-C(2))-methyltransferase RlmN [Dysgonamonadaceae bacterium]